MEKQERRKISNRIRVLEKYCKEDMEHTKEKGRNKKKVKGKSKGKDSREEEKSTERSVMSRTRSSNKKNIDKTGKVAKVIQNNEEET